jgi:tetratricopeptide (TPR) repeat protein
MFLSNLASFYLKTGNLNEAKRLLTKAVEIRKKVFGPYHPEVARLMIAIGHLYQGKSLVYLAENYYRGALEVYEKNGANNIRDIVSARLALGILYRIQNAFQPAQRIVEQSCAICEKYLGKTDERTGECIVAMGEIFHDLKKYGEAESYYLRGLDVLDSISPPPSLLLAKTHYFLGMLYYDIKRWSDAQSFYEKALFEFERELGPNHDYVGDVLDSMAQLYLASSKYERAEPLYLRALDIYIKQLGESHEYVTSIYRDLALVYAGLKRPKDARKYENLARKKGQN